MEGADGVQRDTKTASTITFELFTLMESLIIAIES